MLAFASLRINYRDPTSLIPSLDSSSDGVEDDQDVENSWVLPPVRDFLMKNAAVLVIELMDLVDVMGALRDQGTFDQIAPNIMETVLGGECVHVLDELRFGNTSKRVLDSGMCQLWTPITAVGRGSR